MANLPKQWIVLMNKVPRGPLSEEQVRALLKEGLIRHNDTAFQIAFDENGEKKPSEWKLLWQFTEFDRRTEENAKDKIKPRAPQWAGSSTPVAPKPEAERRKEVTATEVKAKVHQALPPEMLDIAPEDLVVHSTTHNEISPSSPIPEETGSHSAPGFNLPSLKVLGGLTGILLLLVIVGVFRGGKLASISPPAPPPQNTNHIGASNVVRSRTLPSARLPSRPAGTKPTYGNAGPRPVSPRAPTPEPRTPASASHDEDRHEADRGEIERNDDEEQDEDTPHKRKAHRPNGNRRSRVLSDEEDDGGGGGGGGSGSGSGFNSNGGGSNDEPLGESEE